MASDTLEHAITTGVKYQNLSGAMLVWSPAGPDGRVDFRGAELTPDLVEEVEHQVGDRGGRVEVRLVARPRG